MRMAARLPAIVRFFAILAAAAPAASAASAAAPADDCRTIYVADHGWHTGLIVPRRDFDPRASLRTAVFDRKKWLEFGWGDAAFYQARETSIRLALRALFSPTATVMHVYAFDGAPKGNFPNSEVLPVRVTGAGLRKMLGFVREHFAKDGNGHPKPIKRGLYGLSFFFHAVGSYSWERTCNTWTAEALVAAGLDVDPAEAMNASGVTDQIVGLDVAACGSTAAAAG